MVDKIKDKQKSLGLAKSSARIVLSDWVVVYSFIFGGCCSNVFALESLVRIVPKSGNLITFGQFLFITLVGLPSHLYIQPDKLLPRLRKRNIPLQRWFVMVALYFGVSVLNNLAFGFQVSMPLHIVFRSSGLIANMVCGYIFMSKRYHVMQIVSVVLVTVGVVIATFASIGQTAEEEQSYDNNKQESFFGIILLSCGVVLAALLGLYQEETYKKYGKHWKEGLFYNHALALPMFLFFWKDIRNQAVAISQSPPMYVNFRPEFINNLLVIFPALWYSLGVNVVSQLACASGVHQMTSMSTSLSLNVVLNLRKLVSLILSVLLFRNPITPNMTLGCMLVFLGTFAYTQASRKTQPATKLQTNSAAQQCTRPAKAIVKSDSIKPKDV